MDPQKSLFGQWETILGVDSGLRCGSRLWASESHLWASCSQFLDLWESNLGLRESIFARQKFNFGIWYVDLGSVSPFK